ncbi:MAG: hypothetical protein COB49_07440 [Alphaproteobacteria bacterium]|nr:MAG: hypothetical protein COB49_07440 [Alphaproteobacteria bacterium]
MEQKDSTSDFAPAWSVENWIGFWSAPDAEAARQRLPTVTWPDVSAFWPGGAPTVHGTREYCEYVEALLDLVPDLKLKLEEHAASGDSIFVWWTGTGTGPDGAFEINGVDRVRLKNNRVIENRIFSDAAIFPLLADHVRMLRKKKLGAQSLDDPFVLRL